VALGCSARGEDPGDGGEAWREAAKKTAGRKARVKCSLNFATFSPDRNVHFFSQTQYSWI